MIKTLDFDALFPGRFLKAGEFNGKDVTLVICDITLEDLPQDRGGDRTRGIISFEKTKKQLVLNRTNGECIKAMFGRNTGEWIGKAITFYPAPYDGDIAIRVKGAPHLDRPLTFELKLPRKKPIKMTLVPTAKKVGPGTDAFNRAVAAVKEQADTAPAFDDADQPPPYDEDGVVA